MVMKKGTFLPRRFFWDCKGIVKFELPNNATKIDAQINSAIRTFDSYIKEKKTSFSELKRRGDLLELGTAKIMLRRLRSLFGRKSFMFYFQSLALSCYHYLCRLKNHLDRLTQNP